MQFVKSVQGQSVQVRYKQGQAGKSLLLEENIAEAVGTAAPIVS